MQDSAAAYVSTYLNLALILQLTAFVIYSRVRIG
jgi:hypothetical protein